VGFFLAVDGNGRIARFLMNFLSVVGGYDWVVIKQENRKEYLDALESTSVNKNIKPFVDFIIRIWGTNIIVNVK